VVIVSSGLIVEQLYLGLGCWEWYWLRVCWMSVAPRQPITDRQVLALNELVTDGGRGGVALSEAQCIKVTSPGSQ